MSFLSYSFSSITLKDIDLTERRFLFSFPERKNYLIESIARFGLIEPPLLLSEEGKLVVVCGEGRVKACRELSFKTIPALILKNDFDERKLLLVSLESNLLRGLNLVEKALFIERASKLFSTEELQKLLPKLGLSESKHWLFFLRKILTLEESFLQLIAEERLNPKLIESLAELTSKEREEFLEILREVYLTHNEQRDVLEVLLSYKKRTDSSQLLPSELKEVLRIEDKNERRKEFFQVLRKYKYPYSLSYLIRLEAVRKHFKKKGIDLAFTPFLEKRDISVSFSIQTRAELEEKMRFLKEESQLLFSVFEDSSVSVASPFGFPSRGEISDPEELA